MSDTGWLVLENIFWGVMSFALFWYMDGAWKLLGFCPLTMVNTWNCHND